MWEFIAVVWDKSQTGSIVLACAAIIAQIVRMMIRDVERTKAQGRSEESDRPRLSEDCVLQTYCDEQVKKFSSEQGDVKRDMTIVKEKVSNIEAGIIVLHDRSNKTAESLARVEGILEAGRR